MQMKMIPANKDPQHLIKESEKGYWHVEITRKTVDPANAKNIISQSFIQIFDTANFNKIFRPERLGAKAKNLKAACLIDESRIIHNPEIDSPAPKNRYSAHDDMGAESTETIATHDDDGGYVKPVKKMNKK